MAMDSRRSSRAYSSALRDRQKGLTRESVLRALAEIVAEGDVLTFTVQEVADRAGVSHRSLYRHFPSRRALLEALYEWGEARLGLSEVVNADSSLDELPELAGRLFGQFDQQPEWIRAAVIASLAAHIQPESRRQRDRLLEGLIAESTPPSSKDEARGALAIIRYLLSSHAWLVLREQFGLSTAEAGEAVAWAMRALLAELRGGRPRRAGAGGTSTDGEVEHGRHAPASRRAKR